MSVKQWVKSRPVLDTAFRRARRGYRSLFSFFPLNLINYTRMGRTRPIARDFGLGRGGAIDRYYIERFLERSRVDIRGRTLEVRDNSYTTRFGSGVTRSDILDLSETNAAATIVGDMTLPGTLPAGAFDCAIVTQTLQLIFDPEAAVVALHQSLKPGGVLLVTVPGISKLATPSTVEGGDLYHDYWRFTRHSVARIFAQVFEGGLVDVQAFGNVLSAVAFLHGLSHEEIGSRQLDVRDQEYDFLIGVRAVKRMENSEERLG